jgi:hypothetical protein
MFYAKEAPLGGVQRMRSLFFKKWLLNLAELSLHAALRHIKGGDSLKHSKTL